MEVHLPNYKTAVVRDIFVFCCFTGLAYADVKKLTYDDLHTDPNGDMWLSTDGENGTQFRVQLLPVARELVERYRRLSLPGGTVFPVKSCCSTIRSLRTIARRAGIATDLTTHVARHSFATSVCLSQGVPIGNGRKMLGHKNITNHTDICENHQRQDQAGYGSFTGAGQR